MMDVLIEGAVDISRIQHDNLLCGRRVDKLLQETPDLGKVRRSIAELYASKSEILMIPCLFSLTNIRSIVSG